MTPERYVRAISLCGSLLVFQRERSSPKGSEVAFWRMAFSQDACGFFNKDGRIISMYKNTREVDMVLCTTAVDAKTRQKVPCVLLKLRLKSSQGFKYILYSLDGLTNARHHVEFALSYEMDDNIAIVHGPTLVWSHKDRVFYASSEVGGPREVPVRLRVSFIGELLLCPRRIAILGSQFRHNEAEANRGEQVLLYLLEDGRTFGGTCLLPEPYVSVVRCVLVLSAEEVDGSLRSTVLAATSRKQLVRFEKGFPEDVCVLPFEEPRSMKMVATGDGGWIVAVVFSHGNVCAVWKNSFKVAGCWTGVRSLLVDDFVGCGSEQMLLLFEDPEEEMLGNFLLTDLCGIHYSFGREDGEAPKQSDSAQENVLQTVKALDCRLQRGLAFLQELRRDLSVKERVLQQSVTALADLVSDREYVPPPPQQEGLVSLWDEESEDECVQGEKMQTEPGEPPPEVRRFWHRVAGESLVFGVLLTPDTDVLMENLTGSVQLEPSGATAPGVVQSRSKKLPYPELLSSMDLDPPAAKRSKMPPDVHEAHKAPQMALLTVTELAPLLMFSRVTCSVLLHSPSTKSGPAVQQCGRVVLDTKDVLQGALSPRLLTDCSVDSDESREDLLSLLAVFDSWLFRIESSEHTLVDVSGWLLDRMGARPVGVSPEYLLIKGPQTSSAMLIHWQPDGPFQAFVHVHCSGHLAVLRFLDSLCDFLPASHHVQPLRSPAPQGGDQGHAFFLEKEIRTIKEGVASLLHDELEVEEQRIGGGARKDPMSPERLQHCREAWQKERERGSRALHPLVDTAQYRSLMDSLIQSQLDGDIATLVEAQGSEG